VSGDQRARGLLIVDGQGDDGDAELAQLVAGSLERAELGVAVRAPRASIEQDDSKSSREVVGQAQRRAVHGRNGDRGECVPGLQSGHG